MSDYPGAPRPRIHFPQGRLAMDFVGHYWHIWVPFAVSLDRGSAAGEGWQSDEYDGKTQQEETTALEYLTNSYRVSSTFKWFSR